GHGLRHFVEVCEIHFALSLSVSPRIQAPSHHFCLNTATPGKTLPSIHSRKAPPAVDTYVNCSATPAAFKAATVSPPPATEPSLPVLVCAAAYLAISTVAFSNGCSSKAPIGPFQTSVAASSIAPLIRSIDCQPTSSIMPSA